MLDPTKIHVPWGFFYAGREIDINSFEKALEDASKEEEAKKGQAHKYLYANDKGLVKFLPKNAQEEGYNTKLRVVQILDIAKDALEKEQKENATSKIYNTNVFLQRFKKHIDDSHSLSLWFANLFGTITKKITDLCNNAQEACKAASDISKNSAGSVCAEVMQFVLEKIDYSSRAHIGSHDTEQPQDKRIGSLEYALQRHINNPFPINGYFDISTHSKLESIDESMKIAYAIGILSLEEFEESRKSGSNLSLSSSYLQNTLYSLPNFYHYVRGAMSTTRSFGSKTGNKAISHAELTDAFINPFYIPGTTPHLWNTLFNSYCAKLRKVIGEKEFQELLAVEGSDRFIQDKGKDFTPIPGFYL